MKRELKEEIGLDKGLLPAENSAKNNPYLIMCKGVFPYQGVLQTIDADPSVIDEELSDAGIAGNFPYPQVFVGINQTILCMADTIYEVQDGELVSMISGLPVGTPWDCVDFQEWIYLTNGQVAVVKDQDTKLYRLAPELPWGAGALNFNGQLIILSPNEPITPPVLGCGERPTDMIYTDVHLPGGIDMESDTTTTGALYPDLTSAGEVVFQNNTALTCISFPELTFIGSSLS